MTKVPLGQILDSKASVEHVHTIEVKEVRVNIDQVAHKHNISDVNNLESRLSALESGQSGGGGGSSGSGDNNHMHTIDQITDLQSKLDDKANESHTHTASQITDLQDKLDEKANESHTHTASQITDLQDKLNEKANESHTHTASQITDLQDKLDEKVNTSDLQEKLDDKANSTHEHTISDITDLETRLSALESNQGSGSGSGPSDGNHTHTIDQITDLQTELDTKANKTHTHTASQVTDLQGKLDAKADKTHTHTTSQVTDLQDKLDAKANTSHSHAITEITSLQTELNGKANSTHTHTASQVTDLQDKLDEKANVSHTHSIEQITELQTKLDEKFDRAEFEPVIIDYRWVDNTIYTGEDEQNLEVKKMVYGNGCWMATYYSSTDGQYNNVLVSTNNAKNWVKKQFREGEACEKFLLAYMDGKFILIIQDFMAGQYLIYKSSNNGDTWEETRFEPRNIFDVDEQPFVQFYYYGSTLVACYHDCRDNDNRKMLTSISTDLGKTWSETNNFSVDTFDELYFGFDLWVIFSGGEQKLYTSNNNGQTWNQKQLEMEYFYNICFGNGKYFWIGINHDELCCSKDNFSTWTTIKQFDSETIKDILYVGKYLVVKTDQHFYLSTDDGNTFIDKWHERMTDTEQIIVLYENDTLVYCEDNDFVLYTEPVYSEIKNEHMKSIVQKIDSLSPKPQTFNVTIGYDKQFLISEYDGTTQIDVKFVISKKDSDFTSYVDATFIPSNQTYNSINCIVKNIILFESTYIRDMYLGLVTYDSKVYIAIRTENSDSEYKITMFSSALGQIADGYQKTTKYLCDTTKYKKNSESICIGEYNDENNPF